MGFRLSVVKKNTHIEIMVGPAWNDQKGGGGSGESKHMVKTKEQAGLRIGVEKGGVLAKVRNN